MSGQDINRRLFLTGLAGALAACTPGQSARAIRVMLAGSRNADVNGVWVWARRFAEVLQERGFDVRTTFNGALGAEADRTELVALGLAAVNDAALSEIIAHTDTYSVVGLPFFFNNVQEFDRFFAHPDFLSPVQEALAPAGLMIADTALLGSMSGLFTSDTKVETVADLTGVRLRAMGRTDLMMIQALGASGVQVAWEEVPQALQTGIAQGYFNPPLAPVMFGHGSQIHYFCALRLGIPHRVIMLSRRWYQSLSEQDLIHVTAALSEAHKANRAWTRQVSEQEMQALRDIDIEIITPTPDARDLFAEKVRQAHPRMAPPAAVDAASSLLRKIREEA